MRFKKHAADWVKTELSNYLYVSTARNKNGSYTKEDVLSVSGELGIVNQIALLGRSYAGESVLPYICKLHQCESQESTVIKSLEKKRAEALKASRNLISALEQGIVTEQTKIRLKELECQISQYAYCFKGTRNT